MYLHVYCVGRVRPVLAGQMGDGPQWEGLQYLEAVHGSPSKFIHATANAPYFGMNGSAGRGSLNCQDGWTKVSQTETLIQWQNEHRHTHTHTPNGIINNYVSFN